jgi:hypothetical protein
MGIRKTLESTRVDVDYGSVAAMFCDNVPAVAARVYNELIKAVKLQSPTRHIIVWV